jgi:hypothetical protein
VAPDAGDAFRDPLGPRPPDEYLPRRRGDRGDTPVRGGGGRLILLFAVLLALLVAVAAVTSVAAQPAPPKPPCTAGQPCVAPPSAIPVDTTPPLVLGQLWQSSELGYTIEYSPDAWQPAEQDARGVRLDLTQHALSVIGVRSGQAYVVVRAVPSTESTPDRVLAADLAQVARAVPDLASDPRPAGQIVGAHIGFRRGIGQPLVGTSGGAAGRVVPVAVAALAATDGRLSASVLLVVEDPSIGGAGLGRLEEAARHLTDTLIDTFDWTASP